MMFHTSEEGKSYVFGIGIFEKLANYNSWIYFSKKLFGKWNRVCISSNAGLMIGRDK